MNSFDNTLSISVSHKGLKTIFKEGRSLLSLYNPIAEAEKLFHASGCRPATSLLILGDPLGYCTDIAVKAGYQSVMTIYPEKRFLNESICRKNTEKCSFDDDSLSFRIKQFFDNAASVSVWEVPILEPYFREAFFRCRQLIKTELQKKCIDETVTLAFSRSWLMNSIRFFRKTSIPKGIFMWNKHTPILIAAPGPSLEKMIPLIKRYRKRFLLASVTSAGMILQSFGVIPDFYVAVDPGFYARKLCFYLKPPLCGWLLPPTAAVFHLQKPVQPFRQGLPAETVAGKDWGSEFPFIPEMPTVGATAVLLFLTFQTAAFTGLDLQALPGKPYSRGHCALNESHFTANRFRPAESRFQTGETNRSLTIFRTCFRDINKNGTLKPVRINAPCPDPTIFEESDIRWFANLPKTEATPPLFLAHSETSQSAADAAQQFLEQAVSAIEKIQTTEELKSLPETVREAALREFKLAESDFDALNRFRITALRRLSREKHCVR